MKKKGFFDIIGYTAACGIAICGITWVVMKIKERRSNKK